MFGILVEWAPSNAIHYADGTSRWPCNFSPAGFFLYFFVIVNLWRTTHNLDVKSKLHYLLCFSILVQWSCRLGKHYIYGTTVWLCFINSRILVLLAFYILVLFAPDKMCKVFCQNGGAAMQYFALMAYWMSDIDAPNENNFPYLLL